MDPATRRNLEITETIRGETAPTLISLFDQCATGMGSRMLRHCLHHPFADPTIPQERQAAVAELIAEHVYESLHEKLRSVVDVERFTARLALKSARPRDLSGLRESLNLLPVLQKSLVRLHSPCMNVIKTAILPQDALCLLLTQSIREQPATVIREGGVIADGFDSELDELRALQNNCGEFLLDLEVREKARTGISTLKVEFNRVHGFYIEVSRAQSDQVPDDYRRRQTLKNAERYITPELKTFEDKALSAQDRALAREKMLYEKLLCLPCLYPYLIDHLGVRLPCLVRPLRIRNPDVLSCVCEQRGVDDLNEEIHFSLCALGKTVRHVPNLGVLL